MEPEIVRESESVAVEPAKEEERGTGILAVQKGLAPEEAIKVLDKVVDLMNKVRPVLIKGTKPQDWIKQGDKFYLQGVGVERIAPILGIETANVKTFEIRDDATGIIRVVTSGDISSRLLNIGYEGVEGSRSSDDPFFTKGGKKADMSDLRKSAYTAFLARGISQLGGLRGLVEDDLTAGGLDISKISKVEYKDNKAGETSAAGFISEPQGKRLWAICKDSGVSQESLKAYLLEAFKITTSKEIKKGDYESICTWVQSHKQGAAAQ